MRRRDGDQHLRPFTGGIGAESRRPRSYLTWILFRTGGSEKTVDVSTNCHETELRPGLTDFQHESFERFKTQYLPALLGEVFPVPGGKYEFWLALSKEKNPFSEPTQDAWECIERGRTFAATLSLSAHVVSEGKNFVNPDTGRDVSDPLTVRVPWMTERGTFIVDGKERVVCSELGLAPGVYFSRDHSRTGFAEWSARVIPEDGRGQWLTFGVHKKVLTISVGKKTHFPASAALLAMGYTEAELLALLTAAELGECAELWTRTLWESDKENPDSPGWILKRLNLVGKPNEQFYLGEAGRNRLSKRLGGSTARSDPYLVREDVVDILRALVRVMNSSEAPGAGDSGHQLDWEDDLYHLGNRRLSSVGELLARHLRTALRGVAKRARSTLQKETPPNSIDDILARDALQHAVTDFFHGQSCRYVDSLNPVATMSHVRRIMLAGAAGGQHVSEEARDVHPSHYGRLCPVETSEGRPGAWLSLACYARVDSNGFITTPLYESQRDLASDDPRLLGRTLRSQITVGGSTIEKGTCLDVACVNAIRNSDLACVPVVPFFPALSRDTPAGSSQTGLVWLTADQERPDCGVSAIAPGTVRVNDLDELEDEKLVVRCGDRLLEMPRDDVSHLEVAPDQVVGLGSALIPFLSHDDGHRALMAASMQRQALPLVKREPPSVRTTWERETAAAAATAIVCKQPGTVASVTARQVTVKGQDGQRVDYRLPRFVPIGGGAVHDFKPAVRKGDRVDPGHRLGENASTHGGQLALGQNVLVAFLSWNGLNFEDGIVVSEKLLRRNDFESLHFDDYTVNVRQTGTTKEEITAAPPGISHEDAIAIDPEFGVVDKDAFVRSGVIAKGMPVRGGDILVGKVRTKSAHEWTERDAAGEHSFGEGEVPIDASFRLPRGDRGTVVDVRISQGENLPKRVAERVHMTIGQRRALTVGDKLANRHGNKGVVAAIVAEEDMPFLEDGRPVDMLISPLGVPSRMNLGQLLEVELSGRGVQATWHIGPCFESAAPTETLGSCASPEEASKEASKVVLFDGKSGEPFDQPVLVGQMYMMKLDHDVEDKVHARSTGPYSSLSQQPLSGRSRGGGQRVGEMEVWALEAYGAAHMLQEIMTVKSDDVEGRFRANLALLQGEDIGKGGIPYTLIGLIKYLQALGLSLTATLENGADIPLTRRDSVTTIDLDSIQSLRIGLASADDIRSWSHGAIHSASTMSFHKNEAEPRISERGLFSRRVFGPTTDHTFHKCKGAAISPAGDGDVCKDCRTKLLPKSVRRERMGHIDLEGAVCHPWFLHHPDNPLATLLGITATDLKGIVYGERYLVTEVDEALRQDLLVQKDESLGRELRRQLTALKVGQVLTGAQRDALSTLEWRVCCTDTTAQAILDVLKSFDLSALAGELKDQLASSASSRSRERMSARLAAVNDWLASKQSPERMILTVLPVLPPDWRPIALVSGRRTSHDTTQLYERVLKQNTALYEAKAMKAMLDGDTIVDQHVELQKTVEWLLWKHGRSRQGQELKGIAQLLEGKKGLLRRNLLGKSVDYSGRSTIVPGPHLDLDECGLPRHIALELYKPFLIRHLVQGGEARNVFHANELIRRTQRWVRRHDTCSEPDGAGVTAKNDAANAESGEGSLVMAALEHVITNHPVVLNRTPTLHRLGMQAFYPRLVSHNAIEIPPLVCGGYNADFDGDAMQVHLPLFGAAVCEARERMVPYKNVLSPGDGTPVLLPSKDMVLGCYYLSRAEEGQKGQGLVFPSFAHALRAFDVGQVAMHAKIYVGVPSQDFRSGSLSVGGRTIASNDLVVLPNSHRAMGLETTVGRIMINMACPEGSAFVNADMTKSVLRDLIRTTAQRQGTIAAAALAYHLMDLGFEYATISGVSIATSDLFESNVKDELVRALRARTDAGVEQWGDVVRSVDKAVHEALNCDPRGAIALMKQSGAMKGNLVHLVQLVGMRGLMRDARGRTVDSPITSSLKEGVSPHEFFISCHGTRMGLVDTAIGTGKAGTLTRRLAEVAQAVVVRHRDCGTEQALQLGPADLQGHESSLCGRVLAKKFVDSRDGTCIAETGTLLDSEMAARLAAAVLDTGTAVFVRSPLACSGNDGVCQMCYGSDITTGHLVVLGAAVGMVAAQAVGEPGTQMTLRTFHTGGKVDSTGDITAGLKEVDAVLDGRGGAAVIAAIEEERDEHGPFAAELVRVRELRRLYTEKEISVDDRHFETILLPVRRMKEAKLGSIVGGIDEAAKTGGFLAAAAFSETWATLARAAIRGETDALKGPKENVMVGKRIPVGTGFER